MDSYLFYNSFTKRKIDETNEIALSSHISFFISHTIMFHTFCSDMVYVFVPLSLISFTYIFSLFSAF